MGTPRLGVLLAMAMFVLVVDTSLMNVSISAVVADLDTTVSGVQSAIALEALVSAAFILIGSKVGDLIGRKRAYVLGLLGYAIGAHRDDARAGPDSRSSSSGRSSAGSARRCCCPSMQSLIHGNFEGATQTKVYALVGAAAAIAAAVGPLHRRLHHDLPVVARGVRCSRSWSSRSCCPASGSSRTCRTPGRAAVDPVGAALSVRRHGRHRARDPRLAGGRRVGRRAHRGRRRRAGRARLVARAPQARRAGRRCSTPDLFKSPPFRFGVTGQMLQQIALGGTMIALPIFLQMVLEYDAMRGRSVARAPVAEHVRRGAARREAGRPPAAEQDHPAGFALLDDGHRRAHRDRAARGLRLGPRRPADRRGLRARPARLPAQQLHAVPDLRGACQRGRRRQLRGRVVRAVVRARVRRRDHARGAVARVHDPGGRERRAAAGRAGAGRARRSRRTPR